MTERPHDDQSTPPADDGPGLADDELQVLGVAAAASMPISAPPLRLRDRILAAARDERFAFIREREGIWLPRADAPVATKALFHDSRDRLTTRLVRLAPSAQLPEPQLDGRRSFYVLRGRVSASDLFLEAGDFADSIDSSRQWVATEETVLVDMSELASSPDPARVARVSDAEWLAPFAGGRVRILAADDTNGRELCLLQMEPRAILAEHEHRGIEEL
jgi:hypothetical protein